MLKPNFLSKRGPLFPQKVYVTRPTLPTIEEISPMLSEMLEKKWVTNFGDFHNELEAKLRDVFRVKHVLLFCNGTIALFLLIKAMKLTGSVITTPFTFPATIHSVYMAGLNPLFCDVNPETYTLDPIQVEKSISNSVSAILGVNVFGNACDIDALERIGRKWNIPVIFDSAHAFATFYKAKPIGGFGNAEMFSFHATKLFTTLEGGAITTNDDGLYKRLRLLINFGIQDEENIISTGLNGKMTEMNAIFGLLCLKNIDSILKRLVTLSKTYWQILSTIPGLKFQKAQTGCSSNNQYMTIEIMENQFGMDRNTLHRVLKEDNLITRKYFYPAGHEYACYRDCDFVRGLSLPNANLLTKRILCLPMYSSLSEADIVKICGLIESCHKHSGEIKDKLRMAKAHKGR